MWKDGPLPSLYIVERGGVVVYVQDQKKDVPFETQ